MSEALPWTPDHTLEAEQVRAALADALPDATLGDVAFLAAGWDNFAYEAQVDGAPWIFRFPKRENRVAWLLREIRVLDVARPVLPAPVPVAVGPFTSSSVPYPFAGYPRLPGKQAQYRPVDWPGAEPLAQQMGSFLTALHSIPCSAYDGIEIPDYREGGAVARRRVEALAALDRIGHSLPAALVSDIRRALSMEMDDPTEFRGVHCDLGDDHILTDDDGGLLGIIDWADFSLGSPHADFVGGLMTFGDAFLLPALAAYDLPMDRDFAKRAQFSAVAVMVQCLEWGEKEEDQKWTAWNRKRLPGLVAEVLS